MLTLCHEILHGCVGKGAGSGLALRGTAWLVADLAASWHSVPSWPAPPPDCSSASPHHGDSPPPHPQYSPLVSLFVPYPVPVHSLAPNATRGLAGSLSDYFAFVTP